MGKKRIEAMIEETLEMTPEQLRAVALRNAEAEIERERLKRLKASIKQTVAEILKSARESKELFTKEELSAHAAKLAEHPDVSAEQAERMSDVLAKALLIESTHAGLPPESLRAIGAAAEQTLLPDEVVRADAAQLISTVRLSDYELWPAFIDAQAGALSEARMLPKDAVMKRLRRAVELELEKQKGEQIEVSGPGTPPFDKRKKRSGGK